MRKTKNTKHKKRVNAKTKRVEIKSQIRLFKKIFYGFIKDWKRYLLALISFAVIFTILYLLVKLFFALFWSFIIVFLVFNINKQILLVVFYILFMISAAFLVLERDLLSEDIMNYSFIFLISFLIIVFKEKIKEKIESKK